MAKTKKEPNDKYKYILSWISEAVEARRPQTALVERAINAYQGKPLVNNYKKTVQSYAEAVYKNDALTGSDLKAYADEIPAKPSWVVQQAVESVVSMTQGGVGRYEFGPYDPMMQKDDKVIDRLSSAAIHFYNTQHVDSIMPQFIRAAKLAGAAYLHVKQKNGKKLLTLLTTDQMLIDPKRVKTNYERFKGYEQRESMREYKAKIFKNKRGSFLRTLNEAEVALQQIIMELNDITNPNPVDSFMHNEISSQVDMFYSATKVSCQQAREANPEYMYDGDEIFVSYVYDMMTDTYFEVINRRYIVVAKSNPLSRKIKVKIPTMDGEEKTLEKEIRLDNPIVELEYMRVEWASYPVTPLFYLLDDFDDLCAQESVLFHNLSIQAPITFIGQASDTEKVARLASVSGELLDALPQTFGVLDKAHDNTPIIAAIQRTEEKIKRGMHATDQFELQAMIGDRATAKEVTSMSGQMSQALNPFVANIESAMAKLGEIFIKLELILNDNDSYPFVHEGKYAELTTEDMAGEYTIMAKLNSSIKLEQEAASRKALELTNYLGATDKIDPKQFFGTMIPIILAGAVNRQQAQSMIAEQFRALPEAEIARIKRAAEEQAKMDNIDKLNFEEMDEADLDAAILEISQGGGNLSAMVEEPGLAIGPDRAQAIPIDEGQPVAAPVTTESEAAPVVVNNSGVPVDPATAGVVANDPTGQGYAM